MDRLERLATFVRIVDGGTLSAAARRSGLTVPAVSKQLRTLERWLGVQLIRRSTRSLVLTEAGTALYPRARRLLADFEETEAVSRGASATRTRLRVAAGQSVLRALVLPVLSELLASSPGLRVDLQAAGPEGVRGGADLILLTGLAPPVGADQVVRQVTAEPRLLCAAPAYLLARPPISELADLTRHVCLLDTANRVGAWKLRGADGRTRLVPVNGPLGFPEDEALREAALDGLGVALLPGWLVARDLAARRLRRVLPGLVGPDAPVHAVHSRTTTRSPELGALLGRLLGSRDGDALTRSVGGRNPS